MSITHRFSHLGLQSSSSSSSLINGAVTTLADAGPGQVDARLLDYLQIEVSCFNVRHETLYNRNLGAILDGAGAHRRSYHATGEAGRGNRQA